MCGLQACTLVFLLWLKQYLNRGRHIHHAGRLLFPRSYLTFPSYGYRERSTISLSLDGKRIRRKGGFTEQLKAEKQMEWGGKMNNVRSKVTEIVNRDVVYG